MADLSISGLSESGCSGLILVPKHGKAAAGPAYGMLPVPALGGVVLAPLKQGRLEVVVHHPSNALDSGLLAAACWAGVTVHLGQVTGLYTISRLG